MLPATIVATALFALLAFAPFASAASDPLASGTTTLTINGGFKNYLKTFGISIQKISPAKLKGAKATLTVTGGKLDPTTGKGEVNLGGGLKFKAGKKTAPVKGLVLNTTKKTLTGKVAGKQMKFGTIAGISFTRNGFGVNLKINKVKLTGNAATQLNKKLGYAKGKPKPFLGNKLMAKATSETQPSTVAVIPTGNTNLTLAKAALTKLATLPVPVTLSLIEPAQLAGISGEGTPIAAFPISGGTIGPNATAGAVQHTGGLRLEQNLEGFGKGVTKLEMTNIWLDLGTKQASVEVTITNAVEPKLNLGNLGRASIADISLTGATIVTDPATRTISIQNGVATLQAVTAATLNSVFSEPVGAGETFKPGDPLGTFSFTAQTQ